MTSSEDDLETRPEVGETEADVAVDAETDAPEVGPDPAHVEFVGQLLTTLGKCVRAHQIYHSSNPVYKRFVQSIQDGFQRLWGLMSVLEIRVDEHAFNWEGASYSMGEGREDLPFVFYKDGVRYLTFLPGFEEEVGSFLEVIHRARQVDQYGDDLITLMWEVDFQSFQVGYIDQLAETVELPVAGDGLVEPVPLARIEEEVEEAGPVAVGPVAESEAQPEQRPSGIVSVEDFEETLFFLDEREVERIQQELEREWNRDVKGDVLNGLFDRLEDPILQQQEEVLGVLRQLLPVLLSRGELRAASNVVLELQTMLDQGDVLMGESAAQASAILDELSDAEMLAQLIHSIEEGAIEPDAAELGIFLNYLRAQALPILIRATETTSMPGLRERLRRSIEGIAREHSDSVLNLLESEELVLAAGAARLAGRLGNTAAVSRLARLLRRPEPALRIAAVEALVAMRSGATVEPLQAALTDPSREVRIAAARGLGALRYKPARVRFEQLLDSRQLREADLTEKMVVFEAYGMLAGGDGVKLLSRLLNARTLLRKRQPGEIRACAARALGRIGTPAAEAALASAEDDKDPLVRNAVSGALRREAQE